MTINQKERKIDTTVALLPMASIETALKINSRILLSYEKEGILNPRKKDDESRYYSLDDLERARITRFLTKNNTMKLEGVRILLSVLEKTNIKPEDYSDCIQDIAKRQKNG